MKQNPCAVIGNRHAEAIELSLNNIFNNVIIYLKIIKL